MLGVAHVLKFPPVIGVMFILLILEFLMTYLSMSFWIVMGKETAIKVETNKERKPAKGILKNL